jgi:uncharacterized phage protein (TIGR01671 family)
MNREIKFRIWNRDAEQWYKPVFEAYKGLLFELLLTTSGELCERSMQGFTHESRFPGKYVIQQYTGLTDKNGVEIWEGDIVQELIDTGEEVFINYYEVFYQNSSFCVDYIKGGAVSPLDELQMDMVDVIGNIYERPNWRIELQSPDECDASKAQ